MYKSNAEKFIKEHTDAQNSFLSMCICIADKPAFIDSDGAEVFHSCNKYIACKVVDLPRTGQDLVVTPKLYDTPDQALMGLREFLSFRTRVEEKIMDNKAKADVIKILEKIPTKELLGHIIKRLVR